MKKRLILVLIALLMLALPAIALADTGGTNSAGILIENALWRLPQRFLLR